MAESAWGSKVSGKPVCLPGNFDPRADSAIINWQKSWFWAPESKNTLIISDFYAILHRISILHRNIGFWTASTKSAFPCPPAFVPKMVGAEGQ